MPDLLWAETAPEELICRVLGDLLEEGVVVQIVDGLHCAGDTLSELHHNWEKVL